MTSPYGGPPSLTIGQAVGPALAFLLMPARRGQPARATV